MKVKSKKLQGFTLIEILVVVALIAILATITIIAINPGKNFADTRNSQRSSDVLQILNAMDQYKTETGNTINDFGTINPCTGTKTKIGTTTGGAAGEYVDLSTLLVPDLLVAIPKDPSGGTDADTGYTVCLTGGRTQVDAPRAENGKTISVKR